MFNNTATTAEYFFFLNQLVAKLGEAPDAQVGFRWDFDIDNTFRTA